MSVILPSTFDRPAELRRALRAISALDYHDFEVIVVDNRPGPPRRGHLAGVGTVDVRVLPEAEPGISAAKNRGLRAARGDVVAFTDDDSIVPRDWLGALVGPFTENPRVQCVTGPVFPGSLETPAQRWFEVCGGFPKPRDRQVITLDDYDGPSALFPYSPGYFGSGGNMAVRADALRALGGFDRSLGAGTPTRGGEDLEFFVRLLFAGGAIAVEPRAWIHHEHRRTCVALRHQLGGYGTGFTAMLCALAVRDPAHALRIARRLPTGIRLLARTHEDAGAKPVPAPLRRTNWFGMAMGPWQYLRSRRLHRC